MMVQRGNPLNPARDYYPPRDSTWSERSLFDLPQDGRFAAPPPPLPPPPPPAPAHPKNQTIAAALKECAGIPVKEFALAVVTESGEERYYSSQNLRPYQQRIFTDRFKQDFHRNARKAHAEGSYPSSAYSQDGMYGEFDIESGTDYRKQSSSGDSSSGRSRRHHNQSRSEDSDDGSTSAKRKRPRGSLYPGPYAESNEDTPVPVPVQKTQQLMIGDAAEVEKFYFVRFKDMQQSSCKVMGKAFVKLVEPKKQTHHPYTKGDVKAPPWWPPTAGENSVRHKEPDHLLKPERIRLLVHILRMIVEPSHKQHPTVQKLGLNVRKLEEVTMEAISNWFNDKEHPENAQKRPYLREIFKIAKAEERFKNGEIDATTYFPVMYGERSGQDGSDDEPDEGVKDEDEEQEAVPVSNNSNMPTPENLVSPPMLQNPHLQPQDSESNGMFGPLGIRPGPLPVRGYHTRPEENQPYNDPNYSRMGFQPQSPTLQDPTRRSFASPGYQSPPQNMYGWQPNSNMVTQPMSYNSYVTTPPQPNLQPPTAPYQLPPPPNAQPMLPPPMTQHHYDGGRYDSGPALGSQLRTGSLGHPHHLTHHGFPDYLHDGGYSQGEPGLKDDQQHMHSNQ